MNFCDKLQKLRKENNITQEGLADRLEVSRQAVSKWESGASYPDTEKLIALSKIFNVSLDELINDSTSIKESSKVKKIDFMEIFNMVTDFLSKTFSMFWSMKFWQKVKFLIEMAVIILFIWLAGVISTNIICELFRRIFIFLPDNFVNVIIRAVDGLLYLGWLILGGVIFVRLLKTRYLDYYVFIKDKNVTEQVVEEPIKELKAEKDYKIVIRDPDDSSSHILKKIFKFFVFCFKILGLFILWPVVIGFISIMICLVISLTYIKYGVLFVGIVIAFLGALLFCYLIIEFILRLIFNRKINYLAIFIMFIASISLLGIGIGTSITGFSDFEVVDDAQREEHQVTKTINMQDNLVIFELQDMNEDDIVIDNSRDDIKIDFVTYDYYDINLYTYSIDGFSDNSYSVLNIDVDDHEFKEFKQVLDDLKHKKIGRYYNVMEDYAIEKIYLSNDNLTKLKNNYRDYIEHE